MSLHLDPVTKHSVQAYDDKNIKINYINYQDNLLVSEQKIITPWNIKDISNLNQDNLKPLIELNPNIIIVGQKKSILLNPKIIYYLAKKKISIETMSIGAACRTFNILLSEFRQVVLGIIF